MYCQNQILDSPIYIRRKNVYIKNKKTIDDVYVIISIYPIELSHLYWESGMIQ